MINTRYVFGLPMITFSLGLTTVEAILDTGLNGALCLPERIIKQLSLRRMGSFRYILANGDEARTETYSLDLEWLGKKKKIDVISSHDEIALVGMELLEEVRTILEPHKNILVIEPSP